MDTPQFVTYLENRAGSALRGSVRYADDENDTLYLREDIREQLVTKPDRPDADKVTARILGRRGPGVPVRRPVRDDPPVRGRDHHAFPLGDSRGVVVSLEPETARDLNSSTTECLQRIQDD